MPLSLILVKFGWENTQVSVKFWQQEQQPLIKFLPLCVCVCFSQSVSHSTALPHYQSQHFTCGQSTTELVWNSYRQNSSVPRQLTPWSRVLRKLIVTQLVKKFYALYRVHHSPPRPYPEPHKSSPHPHITPLPKIHSNIILPSTPTPLKWPLMFTFFD